MRQAAVKGAYLALFSFSPICHLYRCLRSPWANLSRMVSSSSLTLSSHDRYFSPSSVPLSPYLVPSRPCTRLTPVCLYLFFTQNSRCTSPVLTREERSLHSICWQQLAYCSSRGCLIIFNWVSTVPQVVLCNDTLQLNSLQNVLVHLSQETNLSLTPFCTAGDDSQPNSPAWQSPSDVYANCPSFASSANFLKVHSVSMSRPWMMWNSTGPSVYHCINH